MGEHDDAKTAYEALASRIASADASERPLMNLQRAAVLGLSLSKAAHEPGVSERFEALAPSLFDPRYRAELATVSLAAAYVYAALRDARSAAQFKGNRRLEPTLKESAIATRERMLMVLSFVLGADARVAAVLDDIRSGVGFEDLSEDLIRLATLYDQSEDALSPLGMRYDPEDAARARALSASILTQLDARDHEALERWSERQRQVWGMLREHYDEVQQTGAWLMRRDPRAAARFPSLFKGVGGRRRAPVSGRRPGD